MANGSLRAERLPNVVRRIDGAIHASRQGSAVLLHGMSMQPTIRRPCTGAVPSALSCRAGAQRSRTSHESFNEYSTPNASKQRLSRCGFSHRELLIAVALVAVLVLLSIPAIRYAREQIHRNTCQGNLKQFATIFAMYSGEDPGERYPPIMFRENPGGPERYTIGLMPEPAVLYPEYCTDATIFFCPATAPQARAAAKKASNFVEFLSTDQARRNTYVYFGHVFDHADSSMGWLVPMKTIQEALDYLGLPLPPDDELIPAQAAAWLLQLVEDSQLKHPVVRMHSLYSLPSRLKVGNWESLWNRLQDDLTRESSKRRVYNHADIDANYSVGTFLKVIAFAPSKHRLKNLGNIDTWGQYRLRDGMERSFLYIGGYTWKSPGGSPLKRTYSLFDTTHNPTNILTSQFRASVLYMDGHIESRELSLRESLELQIDRGFDFDEYYTYPANDPMNAPQPINQPMMNFIRALRGWSTESAA